MTGIGVKSRMPRHQEMKRVQLVWCFPNRPPPRRHSRQIGRVERFTCVLTSAGRSCPGRSDSGRKKVLFNTDNLHEAPEFGHRAKLAWIRARRGAGGGT